MNKNISSLRQQGGIALFAGKELKQYIKSSSKDSRRLGRWNSWLISADSSHPKRVIVAYQVGASKPKGIMTIYQQHLRHIQLKCLRTNPKQLFQDDLIQALKRWIGHGERIPLFMDMNEHIISGSLVQKLQQLGLVEASNKVWQDEEPHTFVFGRNPIDGVYHTADLEVAGVTLLSFHESVGNHCTILVDITTRSAIGQQEHKIFRPNAQRLTTKNKQSVKKYIHDVTDQFRQHKILERQDNLIKAVEEGPLSQDLMEQMEWIDSLKTEIQKGSKRRCRKIIKPPLTFSPPIRAIDKQCQAYVNLKAWHEGKFTNSNII
jgi:hypothetical protein